MGARDCRTPALWRRSAAKETRCRARPCPAAPPRQRTGARQNPCPRRCPGRGRRDVRDGGAKRGRPASGRRQGPARLVRSWALIRPLRWRTTSSSVNPAPSARAADISPAGATLSASRDARRPARPSVSPMGQNRAAPWPATRSRAWALSHLTIGVAETRASIRQRGDSRVRWPECIACAPRSASGTAARSSTWPGVSTRASRPAPAMRARMSARSGPSPAGQPGHRPCGGASAARTATRGRPAPSGAWLGRHARASEGPAPRRPAWRPAPRCRHAPFGRGGFRGPAAPRRSHGFQRNPARRRRRVRQHHRRMIDVSGPEPQAVAGLFPDQESASAAMQGHLNMRKPTRPGCAGIRGRFISAGRSGAGGGGRRGGRRGDGLRRLRGTRRGGSG